VGPEEDGFAFCTGRGETSRFLADPRRRAGFDARWGRDGQIRILVKIFPGGGGQPLPLPEGGHGARAGIRLFGACPVVIGLQLASLNPVTDSTTTNFDRQNQAKADFTGIYHAPTPHAYLREMARLGYQIGEQAKPYLAAATDFLGERNECDEPVRMLDLGSSYGVASALVKYGCSLEELLAFFDNRAPEASLACIQSTKRWLAAVPPRRDIGIVGFDSSAPAIAFGEATGLLDEGIATDLEQPGAVPTPAERECVRRSNLLVSTGAVGYVTERTFSPVLADLGKDHPGAFGQAAVLTVLRMFDISPIAGCFADAGLQFEPLSGVLLPQRAFASDQEKNEILEILSERGIDTEGAESDGILFAEVWIAGAPSVFEDFRSCMARVATQADVEPLLATHCEVALAGCA